MRAWPLVPLGEVLLPISRPEPLIATVQYRLLGAHWYAEGLYIKDIKAGSEIQANQLYRVDAGDFVYNRLFAWKGSFALAGKDVHGCHVSNEFPCFRIREERADGRYLHYYFSRELVWNEALGLSSGGTPTSRNRLKEHRLLAMAVPLPPIEEQRRIVGQIEKLSETIRTASQISTQIEQAARKLWMVLARQLFSRVGSATSKPLGELVSLIGGGTPSKSNPEYWQGRIPWVSPKDMKSRTIRDSADHISESAIKDSAAKLILPRVVLIVVRGMILAHTVPSAVLEVPATINQDMKALLSKAGLAPEFLSMYLWAFNPELLALVERSTHDTRKLETNKLLEFRIPVPPLEVQHSICNDLRHLEDQVRQITNRRRAGHREIDALVPSILNQAFSGQL